MNKKQLIRKLENIEFSAYVMKSVDFANGKGDAKATLENISSKLLELIEEVKADTTIDILADKIVKNGGLHGGEDENGHYYCECEYCGEISRSATLTHKPDCALLLAKKTKEESK